MMFCFGGQNSMAEVASNHRVLFKNCCISLHIIDVPTSLPGDSSISHSSCCFSLIVPRKVSFLAPHPLLTDLTVLTTLLLGHIKKPGSGRIEIICHSHKLTPPEAWSEEDRRQFLCPPPPETEGTQNRCIPICRKPCNERYGVSLNSYL